MSRLRSSSLRAPSLVAWTFALGACTFEVPPPYGEGGAHTGSTGSDTSTSSTTSSSTSSAGGGCAADETTCPSEAGCFKTMSDKQHCGSACETCLPGGDCVGGVCGCPATTIQCTNPPGCFDSKNDGQHCGGCDKSCVSGAEICSEGHCCPTGEAWCTSPSGACYAVLSDHDHCGTCNKACAADEDCASGSCVCKSGLHDCTGATGCFLDGDAAHCGPGGTTCSSCAADHVCSSGSCACPMGQVDCGGTCVTLDSNAAHCGACFHDCSSPTFPNAQCNMGRCERAVADPTLSLPNLRALSVDASTSPSTLYAFGVNGQLYRFGDGLAIQTADSTLSGVMGSISMDASLGDLAFGYGVNLAGPLRSGAWGSLANGPSSPSAFSLVTHVGSEVFWATEYCLRRNLASPVDLACFASGTPSYPTSMQVDPTNAARAFVHPISTAGTQGHVRLVDLVAGGVLATYTTFPIAQLTRDPGRSFAVNATASAFYFFGYDSNVSELQLRRYDVGTSTATGLMSFPSSDAGVAIFRDGATLYWVVVDPTVPVVVMFRAATSALDAAVDPPVASPAFASLVTVFPPGGTQLWDFRVDAKGIYFIDNFVPYRLAK